jgi:hypothetical protein
VQVVVQPSCCAERGVMRNRHIITRGHFCIFCFRSCEFLRKLCYMKIIYKYIIFACENKLKNKKFIQILKKMPVSNVLKMNIVYQSKIVTFAT